MYNIVAWHLLTLWTGHHYESSLEKAMAPHSSTLAWKIPWTEEPGRLQSMGSLWVGFDWATSLSLFTFLHWRRKWQPTPVFLPGESRGRESLVGESGYHLSSYKVITILLAIFSMLYITSLWLIYFMTGSVSLNLLHLFVCSSMPSFPVTTTSLLCVWVCFCSVLLVHLLVF